MFKSCFKSFWQIFHIWQNINKFAFRIFLKGKMKKVSCEKYESLGHNLVLFKWGQTNTSIERGH